MERHVIVGTAGHIDHGKTTLIKALTGRDTDRLKEEKNVESQLILGLHGWICQTKSASESLMFRDMRNSFRI